MKYVSIERPNKRIANEKINFTSVKGFTTPISPYEVRKKWTGEIYTNRAKRLELLRMRRYRKNYRETWRIERANKNKSSRFCIIKFSWPNKMQKNKIYIFAGFLFVSTSTRFPAWSMRQHDSVSYNSQWFLTSTQRMQILFYSILQY